MAAPRATPKLEASLLFLLSLCIFHIGNCASQSLDANTQVQFDFSPFLIQYKSGRVSRLMGTDVVAASADSFTGVVSKDVVMDPPTGLAARLYRPIRGDGKLPILVYFHGGAFVVESAFSPSYHHYLNTLVANARVVAVSVNYRLAPEHPIPTAYNDSWSALKWVLGNAKSGPEPWLAKYGDMSRMFVAGDSAGGNIAHNLAMRVGQEGLDGGARFQGVLLLDPYFQGKNPVAPESADPVSRQKAKRTWSFICAGKYGIDHPFVNPLTLPRAAWRKLGCKRVLVTVADLDTLSGRGRAYVDALRRSGWAGEAELYETAGEGHVYFLEKPDSEKARSEMRAVVAFINRR